MSVHTLAPRLLHVRHSSFLVPQCPSISSPLGTDQRLDTLLSEPELSFDICPRDTHLLSASPKTTRIKADLDICYTLQKVWEMKARLWFMLAYKMLLLQNGRQNKADLMTVYSQILSKPKNTLSTKSVLQAPFVQRSFLTHLRRLQIQLSPARPCRRRQKQSLKQWNTSGAG